MTGGLPVSWIDPRLEALEAELFLIGQELAAAEARLVDVRTRLAVFTRLHERLLAPWHAQLDEIEARIAELLAEGSRRADDRDAARAARTRARESSAAAEEAVRQPEPEPVPPPLPDEARRLYRALAKRCHPDLDADETNRARRHQFMARVNEAYARGDVDTLRGLGHEWDAVEAVTQPAGIPVESRLERLRATIGTARQRLAEVRAEVHRHTTTGLGALLFGSDDPHRTLSEVVDRVRSRIDRRSRYLADLRGARHE